MKTSHYRLLLSFVICLSGNNLRAQSVPDPGNDPLEYIAPKDSVLLSNTGIQDTGVNQDISFNYAADSEENIAKSFSLPSLVYFPGKHPFLLLDTVSAKEQTDRVKKAIRAQE